MSIFSVFVPDILIPWILAMFLGVLVGATPGLTATMAVALLIPLTYHMQPIAAMAMILGVTFTAIFTGDIPATLLRIPGTPASGVATLDSYELAKSGRANTALILNLVCSCIGGLIGVLFLIFLSPPLARIALRFTHFQYFWLGVFGLSISAALNMRSPLRGVISAAIGLLVATIGVDGLTGYARFSFGNPDLTAGISFVPAMIGLFGFSEVLKNVSSPSEMKKQAIAVQESKGVFREVMGYVLSNKMLIARASTLGTIIGILPGAGADIAAWLSYGVEKRLSLNAGTFGSGAIAGVIAPTSANNASIAGSWIPMLVFGIPGSSTTALVLGAMVMYGLRPGPMIFTENPDLINGIFMVSFVSQFLMLGVGYIGIKVFAWLLKTPRNYVLTAVLLFCVIGSYAIQNNPFDILVMLVFGFGGYALERNDISLSPLILGIILGPMIEDNLRTGLLKSDGSILPFIDNLLCIGLIACVLFIFFGERFMRWGKNNIAFFRKAGK
jgi:TctA family transporter